MEIVKIFGVILQPGPIIAAFFGAIVLAILMKERNPLRVLAIVFIGVFTGVFFSPFIVPWLPANAIDQDSLNNAAGAISGIGGMAIMNGMIAAIAKAAGQIKGRGNGK